MTRLEALLSIALIALILSGMMGWPDVAENATTETPTGNRVIKESLTTEVVANCDFKLPDTVEALQQYLNDSFGAGLTVDGKFGNQTYQALQRFYELRECDKYARKEFE